MRTRVFAIGLSVALGAAFVIRAGATHAQEPVPAAIDFFLHWDTGCSGSGFMDLEDRPSEDSCALFFPVIAEGPYDFPAEAGLPFQLDSSRKIDIRFVVFSIATAAVQFDLTVSGKVDGQPKQIAAGSQTVLAAALMDTVVQASLDPDPSLNGATVTELKFTVDWSGGTTYSQMDLTTDSARVTVGGIVDGLPEPEPTPTPTPPPPPGAPEPTAVVAFVDTGINPYHVAYRDTSGLAYQHPSTYIPGYPADAQALNLTLDAESYSAAVKADCEEWKKVERGKLYWIPGTKIVGAISFELEHPPSCSPVGTYILDGNGHGTMTSSRGAAALDYGACRACRIVAIQPPLYVPTLAPGSTLQPNIDAIRFAANHAGWIDAQ
ncbi:MAG: hypothetical protein ACRDHM_04675, partial [Actinomycetota bacterium]